MILNSSFLLSFYFFIKEGERLIAIKELSKKYGSLEVLKDINLEIYKGEIFGIIGHSGAGKSTLIRCINGLENYDQGSVSVMGKEVKDLSKEEIRILRKNISMIFQNFNLMSRRNVFENIAFPMEVWGYSKADIKLRVDELLEITNLKDKKYEKIKNLSGGQKQRVGIARALALNPEILLCDEATSALDPKTTRDILKLIIDINLKLNITIVIITHEMDVVKQICTRIAVIEEGVIKDIGLCEDLFLRENKALKNLIGEEFILPQEGCNIKLLFNRHQSQMPVITKVAKELNIDFSIVWGRLESFKEEVLGSLIINVDKKHEKMVKDYLDKIDTYWEDINNGC